MKKYRKLNKTELGSFSKRIVAALLLVMIHDSTESACAAQPGDAGGVKASSNDALRDRVLRREYRNLVRADRRDGSVRIPSAVGRVDRPAVAPALSANERLIQDSVRSAINGSSNGRGRAARLEQRGAGGRNNNPSGHEHDSTAVLYPGQVSTFHTSRPRADHRSLSNQSTFENASGRAKSISRGASLDLSSTARSITIGSGLLDGSVTIDVGGTTKDISAGSKVTAAEFAALTQKLATGKQGLVLSSDGAATGGSFDVNLISNDGRSINTSELVVPDGVTAHGDFTRSADGLRVKRDLVNYGSIYAISSNGAGKATMSARNIDNQLGALITTDGSQMGSDQKVDLALRAQRDFSNEGSITSSGSLEISAGRSISNGASGLVQAQSDVSLGAQAINNSGLVTSINNNINLNGQSDQALEVNNVGGVIAAQNGAINLRSLDYAGHGDSKITGGDLLSNELNLHAGFGSADVVANKVTGRVNSTGDAAHVSASTENLVLGNQCLTGDPTYYNTGNIILAGNINVGEDLAIIAGGNITTTPGTFVAITARNSGTGQGYDINMIAGANVTAGSGEVSPPGGPATLPVQTQPVYTQKATADVTFSTNSVTGGSIDLANASNVLISTNSSGSNQDGGNITLAAFSDAGGNNGKILLPQLLGSPQFFTAGNGLTAKNGDVSVIAGGASGTAIQIGPISTTPFGGTATGNVFIANAQPTTSDGKPITFDVTGNITTGNKIVASTYRENAATSFVGPMIVGGDLSIRSGNSGGSLVMTGLIDATSVSLTSYGNIDLRNDVTARRGGGILMVAGKDLFSGVPLISIETGESTVDSAGAMTFVSGASFDIEPDLVTITGASASGGGIDFKTNQTQNLSAKSFAINGTGGDVSMIAFGVTNGNVKIPSVSTGGQLSCGDFVVRAGMSSGTSIDLAGINTQFGVGGGGNVDIRTATPDTTQPVEISAFGTTTGQYADGSFFGGALQSATMSLPGIISAQGSVNLHSNNSISIPTVSAQGTVAITSLQNLFVNTTIQAQGGILLVSGHDLGAASDVSMASFGSVGTGNVTMVAGADFVVNSNDVKITSASATGGSILFPDLNQSGGITAGSGSRPGGDINLIAFAGNETDSGKVFIPDTIITSTSPIVGGDILVMSSKPGTDSMVFWRIGAAAGYKGTIHLVTSVPNTAAGDIFVSTQAADFAAPTSGDFLGGQLVAGDISGETLALRGGYIKVHTDRNIAIGGPFSGGIVNPASIDGKGGVIEVITRGTDTLQVLGNGVNRVGQLNTTPISTGENGGTMKVTNLGATGIKVNANGIVSQVTDADGGRAELDADAGSIEIAPGGITLSVNGTGKGGSISLKGAVLLSGGAPLVFNGNGAGGGDGGDISIWLTSGDIYVGSGIGQISASATGANGSIAIRSFSLLEVTPTAVLSAANVSLISDASSGNGVVLNKSISGSETVNLEVADSGSATITSSGTISGGELTVGAGSASTSLTTDVAAFAAHTKGGNITLAEANGLQFNKSDLGGGKLTVNNAAGGSYQFNGDVTANGGIDLTTSGLGTITGAGVLKSSGLLDITTNTGDVVLNTQVGALQVSSLGLAKFNQTGALQIEASSVVDLRVRATGAVTVAGAIDADPVTITSLDTITLKNNITANDGIVIVSRKSVMGGATIQIDGSNSSGDGGNIVIVAGADFDDDGDTVTINGVGDGGNINLATTGITKLTTASSFATGDGGDLTLVAFDNSNSTGSIFLSSGTTLSSGGGAGGHAGDVVVVGGNNTFAATAVNVGPIDTTGGLDGFGKVTVQAARPETPVTIDALDGSYSGTFVSDVTTLGDVGVNGVTTHGADVSVTSGHTIVTNSVNTSATTADNDGGDITLTAGLNSVNAEAQIGFVNANGFGSGKGGTVKIGGGPSGLKVLSVNANGGSTGAGGSVTVTANTFDPYFAFPISAAGGGTSGDGGTIVIRNAGPGGISVNNGVFNVGSNGGNGGHLTFDATVGTTDGKVILNVSSINVDGVSGGDAGSITVKGKSIDAAATGLLLSAQGVLGSGQITLVTTGGDLTTDGEDLTATSSGGILLDLSGAIDTSANSADSGEISLTALGGSINGGTSGIDTSARTAGFKGGKVQLTANSASGGISIGSIDANGNGGSDGAEVTLTAGGGAVSVGSIHSDAGTSGTGGTITISSESALALKVSELSSNGGSGSGVGGTILVSNLGTAIANGGISLENASIEASGVDGGGSISLSADGTVDGSISSIGNSVITAGTSDNSSPAGSIDIVGANISVNGGDLTIAAGDQLNTSGVGDVSLQTTAGSVLTNGNNISVSSAGDIDLSIAGGTIDSTSSSGGGDVSLTAGGDLNGSLVSIDSSSTGNTFGGGDVTLESGAGSWLAIGGITANGLTTGNGGDVKVTAGTGGLNLGSGVTANGGVSGTGGHIEIDGDEAVLSIPTLSSTGATRGLVEVHNSGDISLASVSGGTVNLTSDSGELILNNNVSGTVAVNLDAGTTITQNGGTIIGGSLDVAFTSGPVSLDTDVASLTSNAAGQVLTIDESNAIQLGSQVISQLDVTTTAGNISTIDDIVNFDALNLEALGGFGITIDDSVTANANGVVDLTTTNGAISQSASGAITTSGNGSLDINLLGGTPGSALLNAAPNSVNLLNGQGGGTIALANGSNELKIGTLGSTQSLVASTSSANGIEITENISTTGTLKFDTPRFVNLDNTVQAGGATPGVTSIEIQNLTGGLTVVGGVTVGASVLTGITPTAGIPGSPSDPTAIVFRTADGAAFNLFGDMEFNGDVEMFNLFGTTTSKGANSTPSVPDSSFHGNDNVTLNTAVWMQEGTAPSQPQITGNDFILNIAAGGTIINTDGDVNFATDTTINGSNFAIIARNDINLGNITINLSNDSGAAGTLSLISGYTFTTSSGGQKQTLDPYTFSVPSLTGTHNINGGNVTINTSATGTGNDGGNVLAIARGGSITLGSIDASSQDGVGGSVTIVGENGVTVGNIDVSGGTTGGAVNLSVSTPQTVLTPGPIVVTDGTITGGTFTSNSTSSAGDLSLNAITGASSVTLQGAATASDTINQSGAGVVNANSLTVKGANGTASLKTNVGTLNTVMGSGTGLVDIDNGSTAIALGSISGSSQDLTVGTTSTIGTTGGAFTVDQLNLTGAGITLATTVTANGTSSLDGTGGNVDITGSFIGSGDKTITVGAGSINLQGALTGGAVTLETTNGSVSQTSAGAVNATTLNIVANNAGSFNLATATTNKIDTINTDVTGAGSVQLNNGGNDIDVNTIVGTTQNLSVTNAGDIDVLGAAFTVNQLTLSGTNVDITTQVTANGLTNVGASSGGVNIQTGGSLIGSGQKNISVGAGTISLNGALTGPVVNLTTTGGNVTQNSSGIVTATTLNAVLNSAGSINLSAANNVVTNLTTNVTGNGSVTLNNGTTALNLVTVSGSALQDLSLTTSGTLDLQSGFSIDQLTLSGGGLGLDIDFAIQTSGLTNITATAGNLSVTAAGSVTGVGVKTLRATGLNGNVTVSGAVSGNGVTLRTDNGGDISLAVDVNGATTVDIISADAITQSGGSVIGGALTVGFGAASATLTTDVASLATNAAAGSLIINEDDGIQLLSQTITNLTVNAGKGNAGDITTGAAVTASGTLILDNNNGGINLTNTVTGNTAVTLDSSGGILQGGGSVNGGALTVAFGTGPVTLTTDVTSLTATGSTLTINEDDGIQLLGQTLTNLTVNAGRNNAGAITTGAAISVAGNLILDNNNGAITLNNSITGTTGVTLDAIGSITQGAGVVNAGALVVAFTSGPVQLTTDVASLSTSAAAGTLTINEDDGIQLLGQNITNLTVNAGRNNAGAITTGALVSAAGTLILDNNNGAINLSNGITGTTAVTLDTSTTISQTGGSINGGALTLVYATGPVTLTTDVASLATTAAGTSLTINEDDGIQLLGQTLINLTVNAGRNNAGAITTGAGNTFAGTVLLDNNNGDITVSNSLSNSGTTTLDASNAITIATGGSLTGTGPKILTAGAGDITLNGAVSGSSINLTTVNGDIAQSAAGILTTAGTLTLNLNGGTPGSAALDTAANSVGTLSATGTGAVDFSNGTTNLLLGSFGSAQSFAVATSGSITTTGDITTSGDIDLITPTLINGFDLSGRSIEVASQAGSGLSVNGLAGGTLNATGVGQNVSFTATDLDLNLFGDITFVSKADLFAVDDATQTFRVNTGADIVGQQALTVNACDVELIGSIVGNPLKFVCDDAGLTIANSQGAVTLAGDIEFLSQSVAIIAATNIVAGTATSINLSNPGGPAGNLTLVAGYNFIPNTGGQVEDNTNNFTNFAPNTNGGSILFLPVNINLSSGTGVAGSVLAVANGGTLNDGGVYLGDINASGVVGGTVTVVSERAVTIGSVNTSGTSTSGNINLSVAQVTSSGSPSVFNGVLSGGTFAAGATAAGNIAFNTLNAGGGNVTLQGGLIASDTVGVIGLGSTVLANVLNINSGLGIVEIDNSTITTLNSTASGNVSLLKESNGLTLGTVSGATQALSVVAGGAITTGATALNLGSLSLQGSNTAGLDAISLGANITTAGDLNLSASGNGDISIAAGRTLAGANISLIGLGNGKINLDGTLNAGPGVVRLQAGSDLLDTDVNLANVTAGRIILASTNGDVGDQSAGDRFNTTLTNLELESFNGNVFVQSDLAAGVLTIRGFAGQDFDVLATGIALAKPTKNPSGIQLNDITTTAGDINIAQNLGKMLVNPGATILANEGNINLAITTPDKRAYRQASITFGAGVDVQALATTPGLGNLTVTVGPQAATPGRAPTRKVTIDTSLGGQVLFGKGVTVNNKGGVNDLTAKGANITFNGATRRNIVLNGGTFVADPPAAAGAVFDTLDANVLLTGARAQSNATGAERQSFQVSPLTVAANDPSDVQAFDLNSGNMNLSAAQALNLNSLTVDSRVNGLVSNGETDPSYATEVETQSVSHAEDLVVDAAFHADRELGLSQFAPANGGGMQLHSLPQPQIKQLKGSKNYVLEQGNVVFAPFSDTTIETPHGVVKLAAQSLAVVIEDEHGLSVYDIDDHRKGSVVVETNGQKLTLSPGRHLSISHHKSNLFEKVNPIELIQYRALNQFELKNGLKGFSSEFSIPSACYAVRPLKHLLNSSHDEAKRMSSHMMKTTAVLLTIRPDNGDFVQFFKSSTTAMQR